MMCERCVQMKKINKKRGGGQARTPLDSALASTRLANETSRGKDRPSPERRTGHHRLIPIRLRGSLREKKKKKRDHHFQEA